MWGSQHHEALERVRKLLNILVLDLKRDTLGLGEAEALHLFKEFLPEFLQVFPTNMAPRHTGVFCWSKGSYNTSCTFLLRPPPPSAVSLANLWGVG